MSEEKFYYSLNKRKTDWSQYRLILPIVSVGNVGQLTIDLLLSTLINNKECSLVGRIFSDTLMSVTGPDPYNNSSKEIMTTCQVYESSEHKLIIVQQRAPCFQEKNKKFINELVNWIKINSFKEVIILSSSFSQYLSSTLSHNERYPLRILTTCTVDKDYIHKVYHDKDLQKVDQFNLTPNTNGVYHLPGSGNSKSLFKLCDSNNIKAIMMIMFCSEGDNTYDAFACINELNKLLQITEKSDEKLTQYWKIPVSWNDMYGNEIPDEIF